jgi:hypothetical protein
VSRLPGRGAGRDRRADGWRTSSVRQVGEQPFLHTTNDLGHRWLAHAQNGRDLMLGPSFQQVLEHLGFSKAHAGSWLVATFATAARASLCSLIGSGETSDVPHGRVNLEL